MKGGRKLAVSVWGWDKENLEEEEESEEKASVSLFRGVGSVYTKVYDNWV